MGPKSGEAEITWARKNGNGSGGEYFIQYSLAPEIGVLTILEYIGSRRSRRMERIR